MIRRRRTGKRSRKLLYVVIAVLLFFAWNAVFRIGDTPYIHVKPEVDAIGKATTIHVEVLEKKRGLSGVRVELLQGDNAHLLEERSYTPRPSWAFWGERTQEDGFDVVAGSDVVDGLKEGEATIRVTVDRAGAWLRWPDPEVNETTLPVMLIPPSIGIASSATYVNQGGCEAVVYRVGATSVKDGVRAGEMFFPGYPLPGGAEGDRFALFAVPFDLGDVSQIRLQAADKVGNRSEAAFVDRLFRKKFRNDRLGVSDSFMEKVVPAIMSQTPGFQDRGSLLENYLAINGEMRVENAAHLIELAGRTRPEFMWNAPFVSLANSQKMAGFGDRRAYIYNGATVDNQVHQGVDLASVRMANVPAANDGVVLLAGFFGIYGNAVMIDHGYGLQSLYGHLSSINVEVGAEVSRGETIGRTGATGLAGGDHLHFAILLHGMPVNPVEWWDGHWIRDRLKNKLGDALPYAR